MKPFQFSLEKMKNYKRQMLQKEQNTLSQLNGVRYEIESNMETAHQNRQASYAQYQKKQEEGLITFHDMSGHNFLMDNMALQLEGYKKELANIQVRIDHQTKIVLEAHNEVRGLEKLEEKQRQEHNKEVQKEDELAIAEIISTAMSSKVYN